MSLAASYTPTVYQCPKAYQYAVLTEPPDSQQQSEAVDAWEAFSPQLDLYCWLWPECIVTHFLCIVVHKTHKGKQFTTVPDPPSQALAEPSPGKSSQE